MSKTASLIRSFCLCFIAMTPAFAYGSLGTAKDQGSGDTTSNFARPYSAIDSVETSGIYSRGKDLQKSKIVCPGTASFEWKYAPTNSCTESFANTDFLNAIDRGFNKCVATGARAAGLSPGFSGAFKGTVHHKGFGGDDRHQKAPGNTSLHNVGRAVDIAAIDVNGRQLVYANVKDNPNGTDARFFNAFRTCWSTESRSASSCSGTQNTTEAGYFGSIGCEDSKHEKHMHISLPICDQKGFKIAMLEYRMKSIMTFLLLFSGTSTSQATDPSRVDNINLKLSGGAIVTGKAEFVEEPVDEPVKVTLSIKCARGSTHAIEKGKSVCDFVSVKEDPKTKKILLSYLEPTIVNDELACSKKPTSKSYDNPCK